LLLSPFLLRRSSIAIIKNPNPNRPKAIELRKKVCFSITYSAGLASANLLNASKRTKHVNITTVIPQNSSIKLIFVELVKLDTIKMAAATFIAIPITFTITKHELY
jgi:hypothetical protein